MAHKKASIGDFADKEIRRTKAATTVSGPSRGDGFKNLISEYWRLTTMLSGVYIAFSFFFVIEDAPLSLMAASGVLAVNGAFWVAYKAYPSK